MLHVWLPRFKYLAIIGLCPYFSARRRTQQHWQQLYTLLLLAVNWSFTVYGVAYQPLDADLIVSNFVSVTVFISQSIALTVCLLEASLTYAQHEAFLRQSQRIEMLFRQRLHTVLCCWALRRRQCRWYALYGGIVYGCILITIVVISFKFYYGYFWYSLGCILVLRARCLQAIIYMNYIGYYVEMLNLKLKSLVSCRITKQRLCLDVNYKMLESFDYLLQLRRAYLEISKLSLLFNDLCGYSMYALFTVHCLDIIINTYWTFLTLANIYEFYFIYLTMSTVVPLALIIAYMCYAGESCKQQGNQTGTLVRRLLRSTHKDANQKVYNDLLLELAMQIMQDPIRISAKGFINIDLRLLMSIVAAIVTNLVILMQFRIVEIEPGDADPTY